MSRGDVAALVVLADDRTGALETAGLCADAGWGSVPVVAYPDVPPEAAAVAVVDLGSRHLAAEVAGDRAVAAAAHTPARRVGHKIDSTLRGNWAAELVARQAATGHRVLVVPAFPAVGRTCVDGVAHVDGAPLATDEAGHPRGGPWSNRPADVLLAAGAPAPASLRNAADVAAWASYDASPSFAVCDAVTTADLAAIGRAWASLDGVVLAGSAGTLGAGATALLAEAPGGPLYPVAPPRPAPALVVCGSLHPVARRQVAALAGRAGAVVWTPSDDPATAVGTLAAGGTAVLTTTDATTDPPDEVAASLAAAAHRVMAAVDVATLVIVGGDTAAAVLGDAPFLVGGTLAPGVPWGRHLDGGPLVVTKAGGFGDDETLLRLLPGRMGE